ncbi:hypothetical protein [Acinetobacter beijerinckii]|uniref:hypothetical protein n=1 Tax=Acinetobacter beijerinckii TaxID=262668 RepID=UPI0040553611
MVDSFGYKEVSPHHCQIMVAKRKRVDRLIAKGSAHPKVSPSRSAAEGTRRVAHQKDKLFSVLWLNGLSKPTGNVGQQVNDNPCKRSRQFTDSEKSNHESKEFK